MSQRGAGSDCATESLSAAKRTDRLWDTPAFRSMAQRTIVTADTHNTSGFCSRTLQHLIALPVFSAAICATCASRDCAALRCVRASFVFLPNEILKGRGSIYTYPTPTGVTLRH
jgi:hypothetical protein